MKWLISQRLLLSCSLAALSPGYTDENTFSLLFQKCTFFFFGSMCKLQLNWFKIKISKITRLHLVYLCGWAETFKNLFILENRKKNGQRMSNPYALDVTCKALCLYWKTSLNLYCQYKYDYICFLNKMLLCCNWTHPFIVCLPNAQTACFIHRCLGEKNFA